MDWNATGMVREGRFEQGERRRSQRLTTKCRGVPSQFNGHKPIEGCLKLLTRQPDNQKAGGCCRIPPKTCWRGNGWCELGDERLGLTVVGSTKSNNHDH